MRKQHAAAGAAIVILAAAAVVAYLGTKGAGPVALTKYTEQREGPLQEHLVTAAELGSQPVKVPHAYPDRVAPGISQLVAHGFAPLWDPPDPQIAALPAEQAW